MKPNQEEAKDDTSTPKTLKEIGKNFLSRIGMAIVRGFSSGMIEAMTPEQIETIFGNMSQEERRKWAQFLGETMPENVKPYLSEDFPTEK